MYALKARDKLHKKQKDEYEARHSPRNPRGKSKPAKQSSQPVTVNREAKYVGSFSIDMTGGWKSDFAKTVKHQLSRVDTKDSTHVLMFVSVRISIDGVKVLSPDGRDVIMAHALKRILYCSADSKKHLFALVARNPQEGSDGVYTHVFMTDKKDQANELNQIVSKAFKVHFASKTIGRQRKEIVQQNPQKQRRSPSPHSVSPRNSRSNLPHNPGSVSPNPPYNPAVHSSAHSQEPPLSPPYNPAMVPTQHAGPQPWTVQQSNNVRVSNGSSQVTAGRPKRMSELVQESGVLELEIATIQQRLVEINEQMRELAGIEDAMVQLTMQISNLQAKLEDKKRQHHTLQFQMQDLAVQDHNHLAAPGASALMPPPSYPGTAHNGGDPLPDFRALSLEDADWFHEGIPRDIAMEILSQQPEGSFIVRQSSSSPGSYALTMKAPNNSILNYLIENVNGGVRLQGSSVAHPSVVELVYNYAVTRENLPCTLNLSTANPAFLQGDGANDDSDDEDEVYATAAQYRLIM